MARIVASSRCPSAPLPSLLIATCVVAASCAREVVPRDAGTGDATFVAPDCALTMAPTDDGSVGIRNSAVCSAGGWCWEDPLPQGTGIDSLWTDGPTDIWLVTNGTVMRSNGTEWALVQTSLATPALAVSGTSARDVWVASIDDSQHIVVVHFDGSAWSGPTRVDARVTSRVAAIWAHAPDDVWIAASDVAHWDGAQWSDRSIPGGIDFRLWHTGDDAWALSSTDQLGHWSQHGWIVVPIPTVTSGGPLVPTALAGASSTDAWALGSSGDVSHWDGTSWSQVSRPTDVPETYWGSLETGDSDTLWAVGVSGGGSVPVVRRWNGSGWTSPPGPDIALPRMPDTTDGTRWLIGARGRAMEWNGASWSLVAGASGLGGALVTLSSMSGTSAEDLWAVGSQAAMPTAVGVIAHRDATGWHRSAEFPGGLTSVWARQPNDVWAAGSATVAHFNGRDWATVPVAALHEGQWREVWSSDVHDVWIAADTDVVRGDGVSWSRMVFPAVGSGGSPMPFRSWGVSGTTANDVWVVGGWSEWGRGELIVQHWDGTRWRPASLSSIVGPQFGVPAIRIHALTPDDVWIYGTGTRSLWHFDGRRWNEQPNLSASALWGRCSDDVWRGGEDGSVAHWDGNAWTSVDSGVTTRVWALWGDAQGNLWACTGFGGILRR